MTTWWQYKRIKKNNKVTLRTILPRKRAIALMTRRQKEKMITKVSHFFKMTYYAPSKINHQYQEAGYYLTASPQWMCSAILSYSVTFEMQNIL